MCTISIVIPVYNKEQYLEELFSDLLTQSFGDFECIIVDDGSTDKSASLCDQVSEADKRFKVYHIANSGVSNARNYGMKIACGEYLTFIDSDDRMHPDYLANLLSCIKKSGADMVIGNLAAFHGDEIKNIQPRPVSYVGMHEWEDILPNFGKEQKKDGVFGWCVAKLMPHGLALKSSFSPELKLAEDLDYYLGIYPHLKSVYFDDKPYYYYRQNALNSSMLVADDQINYLAQFKLNLHMRDFFIECKCYSGENRKFVDEQLSNYAFFTLFHAPWTDLLKRYCVLKEFEIQNQIVLNGKRVIEKYVLFAFQIPVIIGIILLVTLLMPYRFFRCFRNIIKRVL